jgi:Bacterial protein of unknown function (DUF885)
VKERAHLSCAVMLVVAIVGVTAQSPAPSTPAASGSVSPGRASSARDAAAYVPDKDALTNFAPSELRELVERYSADRANLLRFFSVTYSPLRRERLQSFYRAWRARLDELPFDSFGLEARIDWVVLRSRLEFELSLLDREAERLHETSALIPFAETITTLQESRRLLEPVDPQKAAAAVDQLIEQVEKTQKAVEAGLDGDRKQSSRATGTNGSRETAVEPLKPTRVVALRAVEITAGLKRTLDDWFKHYDGYDPLFTWWVREPHARAAKALDAYVKTLREKVLGVKPGEDEPIVGDPIGRKALLADLGFEMIPYSPEELVEIANRELAWCDGEMKRASRELGFGDDWKKALEKVKGLHVEPGKQPTLVRDLAREAVDYLQKHDLITLPPLAADAWRMEMMSPDAQKVNPFFLGGEVIQVSFPTDSMSYDEKLMSLRANNIHFSRATVHHELIPGHHLQGFMSDRYHPHRRAFNTPFWLEGWALYWEMLLWDMGFPATPEDRVGFLFWRMHRCARIIFSLRFHLGTMSPQECIDFLVERVGHERNSATGEVRRSFNGNYPPLYQAAYMLGGLQFRALHKQLVGSGALTNREFHDRILQGGRMPVEMVRARLLGQPPGRDHKPSWRFAGAPPR